MDRYDALRILYANHSRESDPKIREESRKALDVLRRNVRSVVIRLSFHMSEEGRIDTICDVVKVFEDNHEATSFACELRERAHMDDRRETYIVRVVEQ